MPRGRGHTVTIAAAISCACALFSAKVLVACVDLDSLGNGRPDATAPDSDADAAPPLPVDLCSHDQPSADSGLDDDTTTDLPPFVLAIDQAVFDPEKIHGFDLDGVCTCDPNPGAAADGGGTCRGPDAAPPCDLEGGVDNAMGVLAKISTPGDPIEKLPNRLVANGRRTLLLRIAQYNGLANDGHVAIGAIVSEGIRAQGCDASTLHTDTNTWSPGRCGNDAWTLNGNSVVGAVPVVVGIGYVRDFRLVVRLNSAAQLPFTEETLLAVEGPIVTGTLVALDKDQVPRDASAPPSAEEQRFFRIDDGVLAGRVSTADTLLALGSYRPSGGQRLCTQPALFDFIRSRICESVDINRGGSNDPNVRCDALSFAMGFVAIPALPGATADAGSPFTECDPADGAPLDCP